MSETIQAEHVAPGLLTRSSPRPLTESLIGRDQELALISDFLGRATGGGDAMLLVGGPGAGKTALLDAAAELATAGGVRVLRASGVEFETDVPFAGLHQVLVPLAGEFGHLCDLHRRALNVVLGFDAGSAPDHLLVCSAALTLLRTEGFFKRTGLTCPPTPRPAGFCRPGARRGSPISRRSWPAPSPTHRRTTT